MADRLQTADYAEMLVMAFMGADEFDELPPDEQAEAIQRMVGAIEYLGEQGHIIVPTSMAPGALS